MAALVALLVWVGNLAGGPRGMLFFGALGLAFNFGAYWFSDRFALAVNRAQPVSPQDLPEVNAIVEELTRLAGLPMPRIYLIPSASPNAFATGRDPEHAAVAVTQGLLDRLDRRQLRAVLGHELSHVKNRDTLIAMIVAAVAGLISAAASLVRWSLLFGGSSRESRRRSSAGDVAIILVAPLLAMLLQLAISRTREYAADAAGSVLTDDPEGLAQALERISIGARHRPYAFAGPATAHLFIVNPFTSGVLAALLSTHPPVEKRIGRLVELTYRLHPSAEDLHEASHAP